MYYEWHLASHKRFRSSMLGKPILDVHERIFILYVSIQINSTNGNKDTFFLNSFVVVGITSFPTGDHSLLVARISPPLLEVGSIIAFHYLDLSDHNCLISRTGQNQIDNDDY